MVDLDELCGVLQCCHESGDGDTTNDYAVLIGVVMFFISEVLPFLSSTTGNGLFHTVLTLVK